MLQTTGAWRRLGGRPPGLDACVICVISPADSPIISEKVRKSCLSSRASFYFQNSKRFLFRASETFTTDCITLGKRIWSSGRRIYIFCNRLEWNINVRTASWTGLLHCSCTWLQKVKYLGYAVDRTSYLTRLEVLEAFILRSFICIL